MGEQYNSYLVYTLFRLPVIVHFRLSGADAERLKRLLDRFGRGYLVKGNNARFRHMLKEVVSKLLSPFDSQELHDAYELNEEHSNAEKIQYNQWLKERARAIVFLFSFSFIISVIGARAITIGTFLAIIVRAPRLRNTISTF